MEMEFIKYLKKQYNNIKNSNKKYYFENDKIKIQDYNKKNKNNIIIDDLLPIPVVGNLNKGKICICLLNPGFKKTDYLNETKKKIAHPLQFINHRDDILKSLDQSKNNTMFFLSEEEFFCNKIVNSNGSIWWRKKFDSKNNSIIRILCNKLNIKYNIDNKEKVFKVLSKYVVSLELFPYHSKTFDDSFINISDYTKIVKKYVKDYLLDKCRRKECLLIIARGEKYWQISKQKDVIVLKNKRNVSLSECASKIVDFMLDDNEIKKEMKSITR